MLTCEGTVPIDGSTASLIKTKLLMKTNAWTPVLSLPLSEEHGFTSHLVTTSKTNKWIKYAKLPLDVKKYVNVCAFCTMWCSPVRAQCSPMRYGKYVNWVLDVPLLDVRFSRSFLIICKVYTGELTSFNQVCKVSAKFTAPDHLKNHTGEPKQVYRLSCVFSGFAWETRSMCLPFARYLKIEMALDSSGIFINDLYSA